MGRMRGIIEGPTGPRYVPSLLSEDQERVLLERVRGLEFDEVRMQAAKYCHGSARSNGDPSGDSRQICRCSKARTPARRRTPLTGRPVAVLAGL